MDVHEEAITLSLSLPPSPPGTRRRQTSLSSSALLPLSKDGRKERAEAAARGGDQLGAASEDGETTACWIVRDAPS